jgi:hypothetical protein
MAFPTIHGVTTTETALDSSAPYTHTLNLPPSMVNGSLLILAIANGDTTAAITGLDAYTSLYTSAIGSRGVWAKVVDGSEGGTLVVGVGGNAKVSSIAFEVRGWKGDSIAASVAVGTKITYAATDASPFNSPSLSVGWGVEDTLWLAGYTCDNVTTLQASGEPDNYTVVGTAFTTLTSGACAILASRELSASSETPGSWAMNNQRAGETGTFAIRPATAAAVTVTDVGDETFFAGETGITVIGTGFETSQGTGSVIISPTDNVNDANAVVQTVTSWGATSINFTAKQAQLVTNATLYLFVKNNSGGANSAGHQVKFKYRGPMVPTTVLRAQAATSAGTGTKSP